MKRGAVRIVRVAWLLIACGAMSCGSSLRPCFSGCDRPLPPRFEADPAATPAIIDLDPSREWLASGISVRRGQRMLITATGRVTWARGLLTTTPDGDRGRAGWLIGRGGLIAKIGADGQPFDVGARTSPIPDRHPRPPHHPSPPPPIKVSRDGELYLGFKNFVSGANTGQFRVTIVAARPLS